MGGFRARWRHEIGVATQRRKAAMMRAVLPGRSKRQNWLLRGPAGNFDGEASVLPPIAEEGETIGMMQDCAGSAGRTFPSSGSATSTTATDASTPLSDQAVAPSAMGDEEQQVAWAAATRPNAG